MPRIPVYQQQVAAPDIRVDVGQFGEPGRGMQRAGQVIAESASDVAARFKEAERAQKLMVAQGKMTRDLADLEIEFQRDTDWQTMPARYEQRTRQMLDGYREAYGADPVVFGMLSRDFQRSQLRGFVDVSRLARTRQVEAGKADLETTLEAYSQILATTSDPLRTAEVEGRARAAIQGMVSSGLIGADDGQKRERQLYDRIAQTRAIAMIRDNPDEAFRRLSDENDPAFRRMDPKTRESLLTQANNRATTLANEAARLSDRAERQAERRLRTEGDRLMKDIEARIDNGETISEDELTRLQRHGGISPAEMRILRRALRDGPVQSDPQTYMDLKRANVVDTPEDFERKARAAVDAGKLKLSDYSALVNQNRSDNRGDAPPSPYKSGRELVSQTLDPGAIFQGSAAAIGRTAQAQAIVEFDNWAQANPRATRSDAITEAQAVIRRYQVIQFENIAIALGQPQFITGGRDQITLPALDAAEREVLRRLDAGTLTRAQADQEIRKIEGWRTIRSREAAAPPPSRNTPRR
jgi:hypothetical protein